MFFLRVSWILNYDGLIRVGKLFDFRVIYWIILCLVIKLGLIRIFVFGFVGILIIFVLFIKFVVGYLMGILVLKFLNLWYGLVFGKVEIKCIIYR